MNRSFRLGTVWGITINLHSSWFIIFGLFTIILYSSFSDTYHPAVRVMAGMIATIFLFASVLAHELSHSLVAIRNGIPVKNITLFFLGGVAHIAQEAKKPATEFKMAVAGPLCSLTLAIFFGLIWYLAWGSRQSLSEINNYDNPVLWLASMNFILALFNLAPGFPLDGGRILRSLIWWKTGNYKRATHIASITGKGFSYLLIGGGIALILEGLITNNSDAILGIQFILIGWFLNTAISANTRQTQMSEALQGLTAQSVMSPGWVAIPPNISLKELARAYILTTGQRYFVVAEQGKMMGVITIDDMKKVPEPEWDIVTVATAMTRADKLISAHPQEEALNILRRMDEQGLNHMPVVKDGAFLGIIFRHNLVRFIQLRAEFKV